MFSKKNFLICFAVIVLAATIIILSSNIKNDKSSLRGGGGYSLAVIGPIQEVLSYISSGFGYLWSSYFELVSTVEENRNLKKDLQEARQNARKCAELEITNQRLREYLNFREKIDRASIAAEIIGQDPSPWHNSLSINRGEDDGVAKGDAVVVPAGVVGQVVEVSSRYSKIMLIVDRNSAVDALVQRSRARGILKGASEGRCRLEYALRKQDIQEGDSLITSGLDGVYPKGISIGTVSKVIVKGPGVFQDIEVQPDVDFSKIEEVIVFLNSGPGESLE
ncbi:rod shape-determining protein MreC [Desulforegula conservatrix]|uniref:rod shape-determining protein MreC n=1 Tax=Desulforegula conservatrix TaxID=153026 RepID=UPI0003F69C61|nr:rod shape-determining protein MreC [Desulforegula conservatrix]